MSSHVIGAGLVVASLCLANVAGAQVVLGSARIGPGPVGQVAVNPATDRVYLGGMGDTAVVQIAFQMMDVADPANPTALNTNIPEGRGAVVNPLTNSVYLQSGSVVRRDGTTLAVTGVANSGGCASQFDIDLNTSLVYAARKSSCGDLNGIMSLSVIDETTMTVVSPSIPFGTTLGTVHVNRATGKAYLSHGHTPGAAVIVGPSPTFAVLGHLEGRVLAVNDVANIVFVRTATGIELRDGNTDAVVSTIAGAFGLKGAVDTARNRLYVPDAAGMVAVVSGQTNLVGKFSLGNGVFATELMAVDSIKHRLYVVGDDSVGSRLYVVDLLAGRQHCAVTVDQPAYVNGQTVVVPSFGLINEATASAAIEVKMWLGGKSIAPVGLVNAGATGTVQLPAAFDQNLGPFALATIGAAWPRGEYELGCRLLHPVTGKLLSETIVPFSVK